jgi:hypothetical protein
MAPVHKVASAVPSKIDPPIAHRLRVFDGLWDRTSPWVLLDGAEENWRWD